MKKLFFTLFLSFSFLFGMEFGQMGSQSFGMAGTGVAVKNNHYALYYNPSLLANTTDDFTLQLYGDLTTKNKNFTKIFSLDLNDPNSYVDILSRENSLFVGTQSGIVTAWNNYKTGGFGVGVFANVQAYGSINGNNLEANYDTFFLLEVPVGYAYEFVTDGGDISIGTAVKFMSLSRNGGSMLINNSTNITDSIKDFVKFDMNNKDYAYGLDLGISYEPFEWWNIAFVAKNVNTPTFKINGTEYKIEPQLRAGTSFTWDFFTLATDIDVMPNKYLYNKEEQQLVSLGTAFDFKWFALRAGVSYDLKHTDDVVYALGLGITVLDIGIQFGQKTNPVNGMKIPDYVAVQIGLGFTI